MWAFCCRYAHQRLSDLKEMSVRDVAELLSATGKLIEKEHPSVTED